MRSGETKFEQIKTKTKRKRKQMPKTMAGDQTNIKETDLQSLMLSIKDELGAFRDDFNKHSVETKQEIAKLMLEVKGMQAEIKSTKGEIMAAQQRISDLEDKEPTVNEILNHLLVQQSLMAEKLF